MEDSSSILSHISSLKDMLDQVQFNIKLVNEEIEANIEITREIDSEIVKCSEVETELAARESELMRTAYMLQFEIHGFKTVYARSTTSQKLLSEEVRSQQMKRDEILGRMNDEREKFMMSCLEFQKFLDKGRGDDVQAILKEREFLENESQLMERKNNALENSTSAFVEEILEDLRKSNFALEVEIRSGGMENENLMKDIDELKATLFAMLSSGSRERIC
ncbi:hypothetical protein Leryth_011963 [Lithospermum erythrorhizon]|nr:hypothetical protein Leryth_011963 [Lithospermum erythrorhizon]